MRHEACNGLYKLSLSGLEGGESINRSFLLLAASTLLKFLPDAQALKPLRVGRFVSLSLSLSFSVSFNVSVCLSNGLTLCVALSLCLSLSGSSLSLVAHLSLFQFMSLSVSHSVFVSLRLFPLILSYDFRYLPCLFFFSPPVSL